MNSTKLFFLALMALTIFACGESNKKTGNDVAVSDSTLLAKCGELVDFNVDNDYCEKFQIPEVEFSTKYGKNLLADPPQVGYQNYHYNYFLKWDANEIQTEAISLGYSTLQRNALMKETLANQLLQQIKGLWLQTGFKLSNEFMGTDEFDGKEYFMFHADGSIDNKELEFVGDYKILCLLLEPEIDNKNGLLVMMLANQDSPIQKLEDFASKSCISQVWQNLKFEY